ncbi:FAD-binding oxidoreductase [Candidatus Gracilibacteria bacterium]|nr:FAD-binding oxidoreductase [Candidatus Gracilibacteria bacterium]
MKKCILTIIGLIVGLLLWILYILFWNSSIVGTDTYQTDFARIEKAIIDKEVHVQSIQEIQQLIQQASQQKQKVSIAGKKYSGGGHTFTQNGLVIDMKNFNEILDYDRDKKTITVQAGITWGEIQSYINKDNLAIQVMQSSNIFSVGGSLSSNIHGRDPRYATIADTVDSFRMIDASGQLLDVSYETNPELFGSVIGGFGLLGVITDVTLSLQENESYQIKTLALNGEDYNSYLKENVIGNQNIGLHYGRFSIEKGDNFLKDFYVTNYSLIQEEGDNTLQDEKWVLRNRFFFNLSRNYDWGKKVRWKLQQAFTENLKGEKKITRNNAMNPPIRFISYHSKTHTDILHEYFIPIDSFDIFMEKFRETMVKNKVNLLSITTRYIKKSEKKVLLNYNPEDMISVVFYINVGLGEKEQSILKGYTQELIDTVNNLGGTYYLSYQNFATKEQFQSIYPDFQKFEKIKKIYDSENIFSNIFYEKNF